ncbi:MBL fold metallo-hydrolase [Candidatus Nomurabacteria bacterium]|nr:MBL fold metallo-hydrolase [Candidatus Nomurabacteria bacterium]
MIIFFSIVLLIVFALAYNKFSPQTGGATVEYDSPNFRDGRFQNIVSTPMTSEKNSLGKSLYAFMFSKDKNSYPKKPLSTAEFSKNFLDSLFETDVSVTWFGHSTALFAAKGLTILTDPVFNKNKIPPLYLGPKPFPYKNEYNLSDLPKIDIVLLSHDHFDHLDMDTIKHFKESKFHVPLGVKSHLLEWGFNGDNIFEYDWYDEAKILPNLKLAFAPARHFSGRGLFNRNKTLWGSWVIEFMNKKIYFGGDSGYFSGFKTIGEKYGPFDIALLDSGQYNKLWSNVHMVPEESVQAAQALQAKIMLPIHWGKYVLSLHSWYEPIVRSILEAEKRGVNVATPKIGQTFLLDNSLPVERWWEAGIE